MTLTQGVMKLTRSQEILVSWNGDLKIMPRSLNVDFDLQISVIHMRIKMKALSQDAMKLSCLQASAPPVCWPVNHICWPLYPTALIAGG